MHFAPCNIRVNAIAPGFFVTNQNRGLLYSEDGRPTQRTEKILAHTPMGRFGEVCDLEGTLLFLASDEASGFVTGVIIPVERLLLQRRVKGKRMEAEEHPFGEEFNQTGRPH